MSSPTSERGIAVVRSGRISPESLGERLDRVVELTTRVLGASSAAIVGLDGARLTTVATAGPLGESLAANEALRAIALGQESDDPLLSDDASLDDRLVGALGLGGATPLRAFGAKILRPEEAVVGLLMVADERHHAFGFEDAENLVALSLWAAAELKIHAERHGFSDVEELRGRTRLILSSVPSGVVGVDATGLVNFTNPAATTLLGWPEGGLDRADLHVISHHRRADGSAYAANECPVTHTLETGEASKSSADTFWRRDGAPIPVDWSVTPLVHGGDVAGAVIVFDDASKRLELERAKATFISVVSHEMRTPLTSLIGALRLMDPARDGGDDARLLAIAVRNGDRLKRLVDDVVDMGRLTWSEMQLTRTEVGISDLVHAAASTASGAALDRGIRLDVAPCDGTAWLDEHRIVQVLTNLLGNAVRFSSQGSTVSLSAHRLHGALVFAVSDEGIGIPAEAIERIFEPFWQADPSDGRAHSGSGLGLAIAKNIVELHRGTLSVASEVGVGTTFTVSLPMRVSPVAQPGGRRASDVRPS